MIEEDTIKLAGRNYNGKTGRLINDAVKAPNGNSKSPANATTLNRQYVHKPDIRRSASIKPSDNLAKKPEIKQFNRDIIILSKQGPKAPGVSYFKRGDFNSTNRPIVLDTKPNKDVIVTAEQNQKFIEAVERAKKIDFARRYYAAQISRQRRQRTDKIYQTAHKINKLSVGKNDAADKRLTSKETENNRRAKRDRIVNKAIAETPSSQELAKNSPVIKFNLRTCIKKHLTSALIVLFLIITVAGIAYINWPNIALNVANRQLDINGHLPAYTAKDFKLDSYPTVSGRDLVLRYKNEIGQTYKITQTKSSLDSQGVLIKIVKPYVDNEYSIYRQNGLTIYIFDETKATWSNGGILYQISADADFPAEDIYRLATSL